ncbi:MAG: ABC transporter permease [Acidimicrobiia bacterium]
MTTSSLPVYDSSQTRTPLLTEFRNFIAYRGLIRLLVVRDLTTRYKRSVLGVWWTLLNPLLTTAILFLVFGIVIGSRFGETTEPYVLYLLSGVIMMTFFTQGFLATGTAITGASSILSKVYVPAEVFAFSTAISAAVNFLITMTALLVVQLAVGVGVPWTMLLTPVPILGMLALVTGLGLVLASAAVYFFDVLDLTRVLVQLLYYMTPVFWTLDILPERFQPFMKANPLFAYLEMFRDLAYRGTMPETWMWVMVVGTAVGFLGLGVWMFGKTWKTLVSQL